MSLSNVASRLFFQSRPACDHRVIAMLLLPLRLSQVKEKGLARGSTHIKNPLNRAEFSLFFVIFLIEKLRSEHAKPQIKFQNLIDVADAIFNFIFWFCSLSVGYRRSCRFYPYSSATKKSSTKRKRGKGWCIMPV